MIWSAKCDVKIRQIRCILALTTTILFFFVIIEAWMSPNPHSCSLCGREEFLGEPSFSFYHFIVVLVTGHL